MVRHSIRSGRRSDGNRGVRIRPLEDPWHNHAMVSHTLQPQTVAQDLTCRSTLPIAIIGYGVIANVTNPHVKYGMTFLMATGLYSSVPPVLGWLANNSAGHYKRATAAALQLAIANCGGFVTVFVYPKAQGPQYHKGHTIILGLLVGGWFL
jgi:hypothetical protein